MLATNWDLAVQPAYEGTIYAPIDMDNFRIQKDTAHPEEAFTVLQYLLSDGAPSLLSTYGAYPALPALQSGMPPGSKEHCGMLLKASP